MKKLTRAQEYMAITLLDAGPLDITAMSVEFGRRWKEVWRVLESRGLAYFAPYAKGGRHYRIEKHISKDQWDCKTRVVISREAETAVHVAERLRRKEEDELCAKTCFHCGAPAMPETHGFDPRCERHHDV